MKSILKVFIIGLVAISIFATCKKDDNNSPKTYNLVLVSNPSNSGTLTGDGKYEQNEEVTLTASANSDYVFKNWIAGDTIISEDQSFTFSMPQKNDTLIANFDLAPANYTATINVSPTSTGTVSGNGVHLSGTNVHFTATANTGYVFKNWTSADTVVSSNSNFDLIMPRANIELTANFEAKIIVKMGAQSNTSFGAFYSPVQNIVYMQDLASTVQDTIDMLCFYEVANSNYITLSSPGANITGIYTGTSSPDNWTPKRLSTFTLPAIAITTAAFDTLNQNDATIPSYYNSTITSGNKKAKNLAVDNIYAFKTHDNLYGLFKVISVGQGVDGYVEFELKFKK